MEVAAVSTSTEHGNVTWPGHVPETLDEQVRRIGAKPLTSMEELRADGIWETDEELQEFLDYLDHQRQVARR
jgi:hypothetical protein